MAEKAAKNPHDNPFPNPLLNPCPICRAAVEQDCIIGGKPVPGFQHLPRTFASEVK